MTSHSANFKLGLFLLAAAALLVAGLLVLGSGSLSKPRLVLETYFDTSVQGIDVGSKVKFRGVTIGEVTAVDFVRNRYKTGPAHKARVLVEMALSKPIAGMDGGLESEIQKGLRARMSAQGVTGVFFIELDYVDPARSPVPAVEWKPARPFIPSADSSLQRIISSLDGLLDHAQKIDFGRLARSAENFVHSANTLVTTASSALSRLPLERIGDGAAGLVAELRDTNRRLREILDNPAAEKAAASVTAAADSLRARLDDPALASAVAKLDSAAARANALLGAADDALPAALDDLRQAAAGLRALVEDIGRNPTRLPAAPPPPQPPH
jgi:ABC-type transporter Mla subunit MlaD